jgi:hypothetical protein
VAEIRELEFSGGKPEGRAGLLSSQCDDKLAKSRRYCGSRVADGECDRSKHRVGSVSAAARLLEGHMPSWLRYLEACSVFATTAVRYDCGPGTKQNSVVFRGSISLPLVQTTLWQSTA